MNSRILVVDDEIQIVRVLRGYLERAGLDVLTASDGPEALRIVRQESPDLILLDLGLPGLDGIDVCRAIRRESQVPIIMVTARVEEMDRIIGLELGADDYVSKPFSPREVVSRVRAVLRRSQPTAIPQEQPLRSGELEIDPLRHSASVGGSQIDLTPSEFEILITLMQAPGRVFRRDQLLESTQGIAYEGFERTIDTHVKNLRKKIEPDPRHPVYILTVHGVGYKLREG